jgi:phosphate transport system protein
MTTHLEASLQRDFDHVRALLTQMSQIALRMLKDCVLAFERRDRELASLIILRDQRIDQMEKETDRFCLEFLVRHQPAGAHLRFTYAALQANFELERVGDYAESIARQIIKLAELDCRIPTGLFSEITSASIAMLGKAVSAFVRQDVELAEATQHIEEQIDALRNQVSTELIHLVQSNRIPLAALTPLMTIARRYERVSDQAKSLCQETIYACTGEYSKHQNAHLFRVLFVDETHGPLSRMAEEIGRRLGRADFAFASAGVAAQPLSPAGAAWLASRGVEGAAKPSPNLRDLANLGQYQLVIALDPRSAKELPAPPPKGVHLQWDVAEPTKASGSSNDADAALEKAWHQLEKLLSQLIANLFAEEPTEPSGTQL